jgi:bacillithiol system protein YtxJ
MSSPSAQQHFLTLERSEQLDAAVESSFRRPVLLVKHSPVCGTSYQALDDLDENRDQLAEIDVLVVNVLTHRLLSQTIARTFGVRHESPQAILLVQGRAIWNGSHVRVTAESVTRALSASRQAS